MQKALITILVTFLAVSCLSILVVPTLAQRTTAPTTTSPTPTPIIVRWLRFRGAVTEWGSEPYHGTVTINAKTANVPLQLFRPWVTIHAVWSNEKRPLASDIKVTGEVTYTHYVAFLVRLQAIRGKMADTNYDLNVIGLWNVNKVKVTITFDENGVMTKSIREVTPIVTAAKGQLHITDNWKKFDIEITGIDIVKGNAVSMSTTRNMINPFSFNAAPKPTIADLNLLAKCYRTMPGFGNFNQELDYNLNSKIDLTDLTTVAANM